MTQRQGKIIIIVAPSGTGKSTLIKKLKAEYPQLLESVSFTTRPQRPGEIDGEHYHFVDTQTFEKMKDRGEFLEWAMVHSNYYGTSKKFVEEELSQGKNLLFDLDVQGTDSFKKYFQSDAHAIFIGPPSVEELERRLRGRGTEKTEVIELRINNARLELKRSQDFDYFVCNDDFEKAYTDLKEIVGKILCINK